ncbi:CapA family protein [Capnocytophaga stomatis]|uniref:CapA family protein n=1 Tax=Capnocytophaga stomatis TaxID=1848904 RepID=A0ABW8QDC3_9FLAO|nr:CapA family protein [Capnocytophaga stomatis]
MRKIFFLLLLTFVFKINAQQSGNTMSLLFMGDVMGHSPQIDGAYNPETKTYDYQPVFEKVKHLFEKVDFAIANLEVTLAGKPYKGYPQFSSPDALAVACKESGIDAFVTANNHSCDRGKDGIIRTLDVLDSLGMAHTGTFRNQEDFDENNLLILSKNGITVGILNYTYGTNGLPIPEPTIVNLIDLEKIKLDLQKAKEKNLDKLIAVIHWGVEYQQKQNKKQEEIADFLFSNGVDIIIGGHPHVLQPMYYTPMTGLHNERLVVYSLGNFVSNQRKSPCDGGAMLEITLFKDGQATQIIDHGYHLVWVNKTQKINSKHHLFEILPCKEYESENFKDLDEKAIESMNIFIENSRNLFKNNILVREK